MGEKGFYQAGYLSGLNAHKLADKLKNKGYTIHNKNFFNEFVLEVNNSTEFLQKLKQNNILGGIQLDTKRVLVSTTEMISSADIDKYIAALN